MPISEKQTAQALRLLQTLRDEMEQAHDDWAAGQLNISIASIIRSSEEAERPASTDEELSDLQRSAFQASDFRTSSQLGNRYLIRKARLDMFGTERLARPRSGRPRNK
jgi:hypothetical protein